MAANAKLSQTMKDALDYVSRGVHDDMRVGIRTLGALENRGMIEWNTEWPFVNTPVARYDTGAARWNVTPAGWAFLKETYSIERPADEGRLTVEEALTEADQMRQDTTVVGLPDWWTRPAVDLSFFSGPVYTARMEAVRQVNECLTLEEALAEAYPATTEWSAGTCCGMTYYSGPELEAHLKSERHVATHNAHLKAPASVEHTRVPGCCPEDDTDDAYNKHLKATGHALRQGCCADDQDAPEETTLSGTVVTVAQEAIVLEEATGMRRLLSAPRGHGYRVGDPVTVSSDGYSIMGKDAGEAFAVDEPLYGSAAAVIAEANKITHDRDEARVREARSFAALSPLAQERAGVAVPVQQRGGLEITAADDLYVNREAWKATSAALDDVAQALSRAQDVRRQNAVRNSLGRGDVRSHDTEWVTDSNLDFTVPVTYLGVPIPVDIQRDWYGTVAISWCRGVQAHWVAGYKTRSH